MLKEPSKSYIFQNSPTIQQMKGNREYRKTLRYYRGALEDGMMVMLEDLEGFPAPVLCSSCEKPVITQTKTERSGYQWYVSLPALSQSTFLRNAYPVLRRSLQIRHQHNVRIELIITRFLVGWTVITTAGILTYPIASSMSPCFPSKNSIITLRLRFLCVRLNILQGLHC